MENGAAAGTGCDRGAAQGFAKQNLAPRIERVERYPDSAALVAMPSPVEHTRHGTVVVVPIARGAPEENEKFLAREHARVDLGGRRIIRKKNGKRPEQRVVASSDNFARGLN